MKKLYLLFFFIATCQVLTAQQEPQYTQFMFNKVAYNPAYAGTFESPTLVAIYRKQWIGLDGSPETQVLSYNQRMFNNRVGIGGTLTRNVVGINRNITLDVTYAYRIPVKRGYLSMAIQPSVRHLYQNWADPRLKPTQAQDNAIPTDVQSRYLVNFGAGIFYSGYKWFAGFSIPRLFDNNIDFLDFDDVKSREKKHLYGMAGMTFDLNKDMALTPQFLVKYVAGAPFDADVNVSLMVKQKFLGGVSYRLGGDTNNAGESVDFLVGVQATENLFICLSYDVALTRLRRYNSGSVEATVRWWFNPPAQATDEAPPPIPW
jgi:type IX secretion system PorP/SprF family membrane protein